MRSIVIPASVAVIGKDCFLMCHFLFSVSFEADSRLIRIEEGAFAFCMALKSICIPRSVEQIDRECFTGCSSLEILTVESGSRLVRVARPIFLNCKSLKRIELQSFGSAPPIVTSAARFPFTVSMINGSPISTNADFPALIHGVVHGNVPTEVPPPLAGNRPSAMFSHLTDIVSNDDFAIGYDQYLDAT
jgi:hypothetical protein